MSRREYEFKSIKEYADAQRELGSCGEEFKSTFKRAFKAGAALGLPFGLYVAYRHGHMQPRYFLGKTAATMLTTVLTFSCLGVIVGTYNCLAVTRSDPPPPPATS